MTVVLSTLPYVLLLIFSLYAMGDFFLRRPFEEERAEPVGYFALASALGLAVFAAAAYALGAAGFLAKPFLLIGLVLPVFAAQLWKRYAVSFPWRLSLPGFFLALVCLALYLAAHLPLIGNDALCYHLYLAKVAAVSGKIDSIPTHENADWPFLFESLYAAGLVLKGEALAKFFHFYAAFLTALSLFSFSKKKIPGVSPCFAPLIFLLSPLVANLAGTAYIDLGLTLFSWLAFLGALRWWETGERKWIVCAGIFNGAALGVKFLAGFTSVGILMFFIFCGQPARRRWAAAALFIGVSALVAGFWYVKLAVLYGNPVHPYFAGFFGGGRDMLAHHPSPLPKNILGVLAAPFVVTFQPQSVSGFSEQPGPLFLILGILAVRRKDALMRRLLIMIAVYLVLWVSFYQNLRFLAPLLPVMALLAAMGFFVLKKKSGPFGRALVFLVWLVLAGQAALLAYHYRDEWRVFFKPETRSAYLSEKERPYDVATLINQRLGPGETIFMPNEVLFYRFNQKILRGNVLIDRNPGNFRTLESGTDTLRREGVTFTLIRTDAPMPPFASELCQASPAQLAAAGIKEEGLPGIKGYRLFETV